jgi:hypothetical protein
MARKPETHYGHENEHGDDEINREHRINVEPFEINNAEPVGNANQEVHLLRRHWIRIRMQVFDRQHRKAGEQQHFADTSDNSCQSSLPLSNHMPEGQLPAGTVVVVNKA